MGVRLAVLSFSCLVEGQQFWWLLGACCEDKWEIKGLSTILVHRSAQWMMMSVAVIIVKSSLSYWEPYFQPHGPYCCAAALNILLIVPAVSFQANALYTVSSSNYPKVFRVISTPFFKSLQCFPFAYWIWIRTQPDTESSNLSLLLYLSYTETCLVLIWGGDRVVWKYFRLSELLRTHNLHLKCWAQGCTKFLRDCTNSFIHKWSHPSMGGQLVLPLYFPVTIPLSCYLFEFFDLSF